VIWCVLTHPRPGGASYIAGTLADIDKSASGSRFVVSDGHFDGCDLPRGWGQVVVKRPVTERPENRWSLWRCFSLAFERGEDLIVCEDDIRLCRNGASHAERLPVPPDVHWVSLYDPHHRASAPHGLPRWNGSTFVYAQMIKFPMRTCELLCRVGCETYDRMGADDQLAAWGRLLGLTYAVHVPSIAQHVGAVSAVGNGDLSLRTSESFRAEYDPLTEDRRTFL
jgi:hypothetical protein